MTSDEFFTLKAIDRNGGKIFVKETYKVLFPLMENLHKKGAFLKSISTTGAAWYYLTEKGRSLI